MDLTYVRDLDALEQMFYNGGTCVQFCCLLRDTFDQDQAKQAYHKLLTAFPVLRAYIVGDSVRSSFYVGDLYAQPHFSERERLEDFLEVNAPLHTSEVVHCDFVTNHKETIVSLTVHHSIADGVAGYAYFYFLMQLLYDPQLEIPQMPFPYGITKVIDDVKPQGTDLSLIFEFLPTLPLSPSGIPVHWDKFYTGAPTKFKYMDFSHSDTQKILQYAKSIGTTVNSLLYATIILAEYHLFGTPEYKKWAGVQMINYRSRLNPQPLPTDGTNIIAWLPDFLPVSTDTTEQELCAVIQRKLATTLKTGSALNGTLNFSFMMNLAPHLKKLQTIRPARSAPLVSNMGIIPIPPNLGDKVLRWMARPMGVGPRLFYFMYTVYDKFTLGFSYPDTGFCSAEDVELVSTTIYNRLIELGNSLT